MPIPTAVEIVLTAEERSVLEAWTARRKTSQALALRARIVLAAAGLLTNREIAALEGISPPTVTKWRNRFAERRLEGLMDEPRPGRPRTVTDEQVEAVIIKTLESRPADGATHWSTRSMARESGVTADAVMRIWHAFGLQPHRQQTWKLSKDPQFIEKVHDVCGLYLNPPERAVVLCVDEKSQIQALDRTAPTLPMLPGTPERATHDYERNGTSSLYAALNVQSGEVLGSLHQRHRGIEFLKFLKTIETNVPAGLDIHLVLDNASSHKTPTVKRWLHQHPRFHLHFTPTSSSWINLVERWFSELTTKLLRRGAHKSVRALNADIRNWIDSWNENPRPYVWVKTADQILNSIKRYLQRTNAAGHYVWEAAQRRLRARYGERVDPWFAALPGLLADLSKRWALTSQTPLGRGNTSLVVRCQRTDGTVAMLKLSPDIDIAAAEATALQRWASSGRVPAVLAFDARSGSLLLEAIERENPLSEDAHQVTLGVVGELIDQLHRSGDPSIGDGVITLGERVDFIFDYWVTRYKDRPDVTEAIPLERLRAGHMLAERLAASSPKSVLLHGDLHPANVLNGGQDRGLVAIDPRACVGDPAFDLVDWVFWNAEAPMWEARSRDLATLADATHDRLWSWCSAFAALLAASRVARGGNPDEIAALGTLAA